MEVIRLYDPSQSPKNKQSLKAIIHSNSIKYATINSTSNKKLVIFSLHCELKSRNRFSRMSRPLYQEIRYSVFGEFLFQEVMSRTNMHYLRIICE